jgi:hypothetical protein
VREVVVILELLFGDWAVWRRRRRLAGQKVIHLVVDIWESDVYACTSSIPIFVKQHKLRALVSPHGEPEA